MQFELTDALIDDIIFAMEDQEGEFYIDTVEGVVAGGMNGLDDYFEEEPDIDRDDETRFISLPGWDSSDGFRLMERFAAGLRNPLIRDELSSALSQGRGVFRAFKNTLSSHPEVEKLWYAFKDREMKLEVIRWYNGLREEWGLEKIGTEPEETGDLVLEDFRFRPFRKEDFPKAEELNRLCREEIKKHLTESGVKKNVDAIAKESNSFFHSSNNLFGKEASLPDMSETSLHAMTAESANNEFAGYIAGIVKDSILYIQNLEVKTEYRGLGLGETLLLKFLESFDPNDSETPVEQTLMDLPSWAEGFSRVLLREAFTPYTVRYRLDMRGRNN